MVVACAPEPTDQDDAGASSPNDDDDDDDDDDESTTADDDDDDDDDILSTSSSGSDTSGSGGGTSTSSTSETTGGTTLATSTSSGPTGQDTIAETDAEDTGETGDTTGDAAWEMYFSDWPEGASPDHVGRLLAERFLNEQPPEIKHYKVACAWYGALQVAELLNDQDLVDQLTTKYDPLFDSYDNVLFTEDFENGPGIGHVDQNVFGIVPLQLSFLHTTDARYVEDGLALADHQLTHLMAQTRGAIDDVFMIPGLQVQAYRATGDSRYIDQTTAVLLDPSENYLGRQLDDGLFMQLPQGQGTDGQSQKWGRGNGWAASGLTELMREMDENHPNYAGIRDAYMKLMEGLLQYQIQSGEGQGIWRQLVDHTTAYPETSGSAMFTNAMITGVKNGWLDADTYGPAARTAWLALVIGYMDEDGRLRDVSDWMYGGTIDSYVNRERVHGDNHGQAPLLWAAAALLR